MNKIICLALISMLVLVGCEEKFNPEKHDCIEEQVRYRGSMSIDLKSGETHGSNKVIYCVEWKPKSKEDNQKGTPLISINKLGSNISYPSTFTEICSICGYNNHTDYKKKRTTEENQRVECDFNNYIKYTMIHYKTHTETDKWGDKVFIEHEYIFKIDCGEDENELKKEQSNKELINNE